VIDTATLLCRLASLFGQDHRCQMLTLSNTIDRYSSGKNNSSSSHALSNAMLKIFIFLMQINGKHHIKCAFNAFFSLQQNGFRLVLCKLMHRHTAYRY
jgi:hypothetical protein